MSDPFTTGKKLVAEWLDRHEYFVAFNADEIKEGEEVEPSECEVSSYEFKVQEWAKHYTLIASR